jgi:RNA polymerase sigma-54 factor
MTPQLQQAIKLLQLSRLELLDTIHTELETNPVLEEHASEESPGSKLDSGEEGPLSPPEAPGKEDGRDSMDWDAYIFRIQQRVGGNSLEPKDTPSFESITPSKTNLYSHLMWQLNLSDLSDAFKESGSYHWRLLTRTVT